MVANAESSMCLLGWIYNWNISFWNQLRDLYVPIEDEWVQSNSWCTSQCQGSDLQWLKITITSLSNVLNIIRELENVSPWQKDDEGGPYSLIKANSSWKHGHLAIEGGLNV